MSGEIKMITRPFRPNRVLAVLSKGETPLGMQMFTHSPELIEIVGYAGFDFVMIDMEHSRVNIETLVQCIRAAEVSGLAPLVRVTQNDPGLIRSALESGAQGIIVPHVKNAQEARRAIEALRYPPEGKCGICPSIRASYYSQDTFDEYMQHSNRETMFIPLLEDVEGIDNTEEIFALLKPGRDAAGLGLADISVSLVTRQGEKVDWQNPYLKEAFAKVKAISKRTGVPIMGMVWPKADLASARAVLANGTKILIFFPDTHFWYELCRNIIKELKG
jgi:2-keto-3-deoxy-L-rhamnonate aldolase RhmA